MRFIRLSSIVLVIILLLSLSLPPGIAKGSRLANFNGDGFSDLAIGAEYEDVGSPMDAGVVHVMYGTENRLTSLGSQAWHQNSTGIDDSASTGDHFGADMAVGDFDGDRINDLAIGVSGEAVNGKAGAGAVHVLYGSPSRIQTTGKQYITEDSLGFTFQGNDFFGSSLAAGDFNGDGYDDLAIGVRGKDFVIDDIGFIRILNGSPSGLATTGVVTLVQGMTGLTEDPPEEHDMFGYELASGDFDNDNYDDLVVGIPLEDIGTSINSGAVQLIYGSPTGFQPVTRSWFMHQGKDGIHDSAEAYDYFGNALAVGDFDGDGREDLAIGAYQETLQDTADALPSAGAVHVLYSDFSGLSSEPNQFWTEDILGLHANANEWFGFSLAAGDFNGDGREDLAIGAPSEDYHTISLTAIDSGEVIVMYGSGRLFTGEGKQIWNQHHADIESSPEEEDNFGLSLAAGDFNGDTFVDLVIGVPYEDTDADTPIVDAGCVHVLYGGPEQGLSTQATQTWWQNDLFGDTNEIEEDDRFGLTLAALPELIREIHIPLLHR